MIRRWYYHSHKWKFIDDTYGLLCSVSVSPEGRFTTLVPLFDDREFPTLDLAQRHCEDCINAEDASISKALQ